MRLSWNFSLKRLLQGGVLLGLCTVLIACETVQYYSQAARGQLSLLMARKDIERMLDSGELSPEMDAKFREVMAIRDYASRELNLPVANNYSTYVDLQRDHVVWNVFATPEFSTRPVNWCFPVAGCVAYRGYFSEAKARKFADQLARDGYDVYVGGVDAYSTLGWFEDSLLSTVTTRQNHQLAGLIFHELAHQEVYLPGNTTFNESFATAVEREGVNRWLKAAGKEEVAESRDINRLRRREFVELVSSFRDQLAALYATELPEAEMRESKAALQQGLRDAYGNLKESWGGYLGYDAWFSHSLNNAQLATVGSYNDLVPFFTELLRREGGDMRVFYRRVKEIAAMDPLERSRLLASET